MDESRARLNRPPSLTQAFLSAFLSTFILFLIAPAVGDSQVPVVTNITSSGLGTVVQPPSDGIYNITGGTRPGIDGLNLFHSFGDFSVGSGDIANFLNNTGQLTSNIIGRVTELGVAHTSYIYGTIQTTGFDVGGLPTNLFLANPNGIVFGPNGSVNVGGSVSFSTAQYLRLFDGLNSANFYADSANDGLDNSVLAMAPVVDFGFLSPAAYGFLTAPDPSATITVQGSALSVLPGQSISLVGREVVIQGDTLPDQTVQRAQLSAPNGRILLASAASPGEFDSTTLFAGSNVEFVSFASYATASLEAGSSIDLSGQHTAWIKGGQLVLSVNDAMLSTSSEGPAQADTIILNPGSAIVTSNSGSDPGADVQMTVGALKLDASTIKTETFGDGNGGNITADVGTLYLTNFALISSNNSSFGIGQGGNVTVQGLEGPGSAADSVTLNDGAAIETGTSFGLGRGGNVSITAEKMEMNNLSEVRTVTFLGGAVGGDIALNVGTLTLTGGSLGGSNIRTSDFTFGTDFDFDGVVDVDSTGSGGHVTIRGLQGAGTAAESVVLSGGSKIESESADGKGGGLSIAATSMDLDGASTIKSGTFGVGHGGDIELNVQNASFSGGSTLASSTVSNAPPGKGVGGTITVQSLEGQANKADSLTFTGFRSGIITDTFGSALPGAIEVHAKAVSLTDQAVIEGGTRLSDATGGIVTIDAESVGILGGSHISSQARAQDAGQVTITAAQLILDNGSIETTTISETGGRGGDVVLDVGTMSLTNGASINSQSKPLSTGRAGDITITAKQSATLTSGSSISASSSGTSNAGNITIHSGSTFVMNNSSITTEASQASGGQVEITAPDIVHLINSNISTSVAGSATDTAGGNILIDPQFVVLQNSQILAKAFAGTGGAINIIATSAFIADPFSREHISASSTLGISGTVNIQSPLQNVGGELAALSQELSSVGALLAQQCAARAADGKFSTFVIAAREGLPAEPGGFLASPSLKPELLGSRDSGGQTSHSQLSAFTGLFPKYDARPIQLVKFGDSCHW